MQSTILKLLTFVQSRARLRVLGLIVPLLLVALLEMASIGMVLPIVGILFGEGKSLPLPAPLATRLPALETEGYLTLVLVLFGLLFVLKNFVTAGAVMLVNRVIAREMARFLQRLFARYAFRTYAHHLDSHSAHFIQMIARTSMTGFDGLRNLLNIALELLVLAAIGILLLMIDPLATLLSGAVLAAAGIAYAVATGPALKRWGRASHEHEERAMKIVQETFHSIKFIKVSHSYRQFLDAFAHETDRFGHYLGLSLMSAHLPRLFIETVMVVAVLGTVSVLSGMRSTVDVTSFIAVLGLAGIRLLPSLNRILGYVSELRHRTTAIDALHKDLDQNVVDDRAAARDDIVPLPFAKEIRLDNICFTYPGAARPTLEAIDLVIAKGESIGIVGPSGAGKSTLADILLGLLRPTGGRLLVDGQDVLVNVERWQRQIGYVPQDIRLMDESLSSNVAFGVAPGKIDGGRVAEALRLANLDPETDAFEVGPEASLGEYGIRISGGQRQRVGIARALYRDPQFLLFDEATSALDSETEREITRAIAGLAGKKTVVLIAHRLSTVRGCDRVVFMKSGRIADIGPFEALAARNEDFARLVAPQNVASD